eukprot:TRINITY_DN5723_c0_g1_i1.p1 TRINITY_DN5723_c0_g1~~TRINITY_DN5723_c0_g1_i1.p1  ORF type:complete len:708 (+),score=180.70 TRINITY_DN5723_c0_g1_i1:166-2289(+)
MVKTCLLEEADGVLRSILNSLQPGQKFEDSDFPCTLNSVWRNEEPTAYIASWKRPNEICTNPQLFVDGCDPGDALQGALGDCYFISALAVLATRLDLLYPLVVTSRPAQGIYQFKFFKNAKWRVVTIDDRLPVNTSSQLVFGHCKDENEMWLPLIEKAYAKLHGYYEAIESGSTASALMDLTGEAAQVYDFRQGEGAELIKSDKFWNMLLYFDQEQYLMGCSCRRGGMEEDNGMGILANHAYSVLQCVQLNSRDKLLRIRNPWGRLEWRGKWSDHSKEWTPQLRAALGATAEDDGVFYMCLEDFVSQFDNLFVCRLLTDEVGHLWHHIVVEHQWDEDTSGGCSNFPTWKQNDQFGITVPSGTDVFICLMQEDQRLKKGKELYNDALGFSIFKEDPSRKLTFPYADKLWKQAAYSESRQVVSYLHLSTGKYILVPATFDSGIRMPYFMHIFSFYPITVELIPDGPGNASAYVKGEWRGATAGGCFNHDSWINNPKYYVEFESTQGSCDVDILLTQGPGPLRQIGMYIFGEYEDGKDVDPELLVKKIQCAECPISESSLSMPRDGKYVIMPICFTPDQETTFELALYANEKISLYEVKNHQRYAVPSGGRTQVPSSKANVVKVNRTAQAKPPSTKEKQHDPNKVRSAEPKYKLRNQRNPGLLEQLEELLKQFNKKPARNAANVFVCGGCKARVSQRSTMCYNCGTKLKQ